MDMGLVKGLVRRLLPRPLIHIHRMIHRYNDDKEHEVYPDWRVVTDGKFNKGLAFSIEERQRLGILGLFPGTVRTIEDQILACHVNLDARNNNMSKSHYLHNLRNRHRRLYYRYLRDHIEDVLPVVYTPTVGDTVTTYGLNFQFAVSMFINIHDRGHISDLLHNWVESKVDAVCVTDGERILGLGDMGANGMGISVGKMMLYTALGGISPTNLMPVCLDVGTNNQELLQDPLYVGNRMPRVKGEEYDEFIQEFMEAVVDIYGADTLIHFEDFATPTAFKLLNKYRDEFLCFNDDIQGTGCTGLAGFLNVERITGRKLEDTVFLFVGAGSAAMGIVGMLVIELGRRGIPLEEAAKNIYIQDDKGLITCETENLPDLIKPFRKPMKKIKDMAAIVEEVKPSILLGATGMGGIIGEQVLKAMAKNHQQPAVFALSNPTSLSECTAEQAYTHTKGRVLFSAGSPFPPVTIDGKRFTPAQANNCLTFPGIALGAICSKASHLPDEVYSVVAHELSKCTSQERLDAGALYPPVKEASTVAFNVAVAVIKYIFENNLSHIHHKPEDIGEFVRRQQYKLEYRTALPPTWPYPEETPLPEPATKMT